MGKGILFHHRNRPRWRQMRGPRKKHEIIYVFQGDLMVSVKDVKISSHIWLSLK